MPPRQYRINAKLPRAERRIPLWNKPLHQLVVECPILRGLLLAPRPTPGASLLTPKPLKIHNRIPSVSGQLPACRRSAQSPGPESRLVWYKQFAGARRLEVFTRSTDRHPLPWVARLAQPCRSTQPENNEQQSQKQAPFRPNRSASQPRRAGETAIQQMPWQGVSAVGDAVEIGLCPAE